MDEYIRLNVCVVAALIRARLYNRVLQYSREVSYRHPASSLQENTKYSIV